MQLSLVFLIGWLTSSSASRLRNTTQKVTLSSNSSSDSHHGQAPTFQGYYTQHTGRGIWKWSVALEAYQRHFGPFANRAAKMLEIGVQSGGSILMYQAVLPQVYYYGMDINRNCEKFKDARTTISISDQASVEGWTHFFSAVTPNLDMALDDGGHQAFQMTATIQQVLPHINQGGFFMTEDIHGINQDYLSAFFNPAADAIVGLKSLTGAIVESVHLYPFILGVQMQAAAGQKWKEPVATVTVSTIPDLLNALPNNLGGVVKLHNPSWASMLTGDSLKNFFSAFYDMHGGVVTEEPAECHDGMASNCAMIATNTNLQNLVMGVHIMQTYVLVEVHAQPPAIRADRKGSEWIAYNGP